MQQQPHRPDRECPRYSQSGYGGEDCKLTVCNGDQLLKESYSNPEVVYLRELAERIEKYPVARRIQACEALMAYLDSLEKFSQ